MSPNQVLEFNRNIKVPVKQVFSAFASSVSLESWFSDFAEIVPSENGRFYVFWNAGHHASGLLTAFEEGERISLSWQGRGEPHETQVEITFISAGEQAQVIIKHSGLGTDAQWNQSAQAISAGWEGALDNLVSVLENGLDKRLYDRPMLGIFPSQVVDEKIAAELGLPINTGIQISGVVPNMGAESAGLQPDDVIFSLNGHELKTFPDFAIALGGIKAGDIVEVVLFRQGEKHSIDMELSRRATPDIPESSADLAEKVGQSYTEIDTELAGVFEGVTAEAASFSPASESWSAKETLVHLLYTERWLHLAISCAVSSQRSGGFANEYQLIAAMAEAYTLEGLLATLKQSEKVTVASLAALPETFIADKRKFIGFVSGIGQGFAQHTRSHIPQIQEALEAFANQ
jgi:uncharacterized protein YndB with AHSA1/START domain